MSNINISSQSTAIQAEVPVRQIPIAENSAKSVPEQIRNIQTIVRDEIRNDLVKFKSLSGESVFVIPVRNELGEVISYVAETPHGFQEALFNEGGYVVQLQDPRPDIMKLLNSTKVGSITHEKEKSPKAKVIFVNFKNEVNRAVSEMEFKKCIITMIDLRKKYREAS